MTVKKSSFQNWPKEVFQKVILYVVIYISSAISAPLDSGLSQVGHDARFSYVYAWGLKDLNDQISFYDKKLEKWKNGGQ